MRIGAQNGDWLVMKTFMTLSCCMPRVGKNGGFWN